MLVLHFVHCAHENEAIIALIFERELTIVLTRGQQARERRRLCQRAHQVTGKDLKALRAGREHQRLFAVEVAVHRGRRHAHAARHLTQRKIRWPRLQEHVPRGSHEQRPRVVEPAHERRPRRLTRLRSRHYDSLTAHVNTVNTMRAGVKWRAAAGPADPTSAAPGSSGAPRAIFLVEQVGGCMARPREIYREDYQAVRPPT